MNDSIANKWADLNVPLWSYLSNI